jgi:phosphonate transport system substrate-binding protein
MLGGKPAASETTAEPPTTYLFGVVPQFSATQIVATWRPILDALEAATGRQFRLAGSDSIPAFEEEFAAGRFDFVYMNPYHFVHAERSQGYQPLVRDVGSMLYGIIVVRKDSPIQSVEELQHKRVAFPAPNALGASLLPRAELQRRYGIEIEPRYVRSHSSVYLNVALGKTDAGGGVQKTLEQQPQPVQDALRVLHRTQEIVPHPVAVHPRVPRQIRDQVAAALLTLGNSAQGRELLAAVPIEQIGPASAEDYRPLLALDLETFYVEE